MEIRYGLEKDYEKAKKIWSECFNDSENEVNYYFENLYDRYKYLVLEENEDIKASLHENPYKIFIGDSVYDSFYIVAVAVSPEYRSKGYMTKLITESLKGAKRKGLPLIYLSPINSDIYRRYGFEYLTDIEKYSFDMKEIVFSKIEKEYTIKRVELNSEDELYKDLVKVYNKKMKSYFLKIARDEKYYRNWIREIKSDGGDIFAFYLGEEIQGYIAFYRREKLEVRELFAINKRGYENFLAFLKSFQDYYPEVVMKTPIRENINFYFKNQKVLKKESYPFIMGRVLNPELILKELNFKNINLKIFILDNILEENNAVYKIEDGDIEILRLSEDWDLKLDINSFAQLVLGYFSIEELILLERVEIRNYEILKFLIENNIFSIKKNYIQDYQ